MYSADTGNSATDGDEMLMLAYGRGDADAFEHLYARHKGATYRYLLRHTSNRATADELHQDVWLRVVRARQQYRPEARFTTWLFTLARHRLVDYYRSGRGGKTVSLDDEEGVQLPQELGESPAGPGDPLSQVIDAETGRRLLSAVAGLPGPQRDAFLLHVEAGLSLGEIAELTGVPTETAKSRLRYAYRRLRAAMETLE